MDFWSDRLPEAVAMSSDADARRDEQNSPSNVKNRPRTGFCVIFEMSMLSRKYRIPTEKFPVVTRGKTLSNELIRVVLVSEEGLKNPKFAVVVPNKIAKTAVARNLIRRQVYSIAETIIDESPLKYITFYPKKAEIPFSELKKAITDLLCSKK